jgi:hypothetical protein
MNKYAGNLIAAALLFGCSLSWGYEETTHQVLTRFAVRQSFLYKDPTLLDGLDLSVVGPYTSSEGSPEDAGEIVAVGARIEDHGSTRSVNHFFDPQYQNFTGRGLVLGPVLGAKSPDFILDDIDFFNRVDFSYKDGQHNFYRVLTAKTPAERQNAASAMLEAVGHVVHHIQDMAQPQHVRNDQHLHWEKWLNNTQSSYYERSTEEKNETVIPSYICGTTSPTPDQCTTDYPIRAPYFATAREYWYNAGTQVPRFIGMADFTAQNYVSYGTQYQTPYSGEGTEFRNYPGFPLPNGLNHDGTPKKLVHRMVSVKLVDGTLYQGWMEFVEGSVYDEYQPRPLLDRKLATVSFLNNWYVPRGIPRRVFTENSLTYEDAYPILLPRAVAFSSGLINHFFRGRIDLRMGENDTKWIIENKSSLPMAGKFSVYSEDANGLRTQILPEFSRALAAGENHSVSLNIPVSTTKLIAAFRGRIGGEGDESVSYPTTGWWTVTGKVTKYSPPEIVIVGAAAIDSKVNSRRAFKWSSKTGLTMLPIGVGALTTEAFGVSQNGKVVVGISTGPKIGNCGPACTNPWNGENHGTYYSTENVATRWINGGAAYYLNGNSNEYSAAWRANADGSQIYGEGYVPLNVNAVRSMTWSSAQLITIHNTAGVFSKNILTSDDGSVVLTRVGKLAAYVKNGVTKIIPVPNGYDWSEARHVVLIRN